MDSEEALKTYLDFLETSDSASTKENHSTPRIDAVLHLYRQRNKGVWSRSPEEGEAERRGPSYESRLIQLEEQLTNLLTRSKVQQTSCKALSTSTTSAKEVLSESDSSSPPPLKTKTKLHTSSSMPYQHAARKGYKVSKKRSLEERQTMGLTSAQEDRKKKNELLKGTRKKAQEKLPTVKVLTVELDSEKERRWKAEQAASRLVEHVGKLQSCLTEQATRMELAVVRGSQLEAELAGERQTNQSLLQQVQQLQDQATSTEQEGVKLQQRLEKQAKLLRDMEQNYQQLESKRTEEHAQMQSRIRDGEARVAGHERELEILRSSLKHGTTQLHQLQELLAQREQEHQKEKEQWKPSDNRGVQDLIARQVREERERAEATSAQLKATIGEKEKAYCALEEEFRTALRIEASRYGELERMYRGVCQEVDTSRETAVMAVQKEQRAVSMVEELTALVRELKGRLRELSSSKQDVVQELKARISGLEGGVADKTSLEAKILALQETKSKLESQVVAQQSVVEGLREERQLWGKELAHQGASLAQERGRMEAELEFLTKEMKTLREQLQSERDAVRVKTKQLEDQADSIQTLKRALGEREAELQGAKMKMEKELKELKLRLEGEEVSNMDMQEQMRSLVQRKEQLKEELANKQEEKEQWRSKFNKLNAQWEEKVKVIDSLEQNLQQLQQSFEEKQKQLLAEKEQAELRARNAEQRLKVCDDAFREQLEAKEKLYHSNISRLAAEKEKEIEQTNQKVVMVEGEMRELLQEVAAERKNMETKFAQLSHVMQDLQKDFTL